MRETLDCVTRHLSVVALSYRASLQKLAWEMNQARQDIAEECDKSI